MKKTFLMLFAATALTACDAEDGDTVDRAGESAPAIDDHVAKVFEELDADGNGALSQAEVAGHRLAHKFDRADADGNGEVSQEELSGFIADMHGKHGARHGECDGECEGQCEHHGEMGGKMGDGHHGKRHHGEGKNPEEHAQWVMHKLDADADGSISAAEAKEHPRMDDHFAEIDANADGKLSQDELVGFKQAHHGKGGMGRMGSPEEHAKHMLGKLDKDGDGQISAAEAGEKPHLAERFAELDADGNGQLTEQEIVEHHQRMQAEHPH